MCCGCSHYFSLRTLWETLRLCPTVCHCRSERRAMFSQWAWDTKVPGIAKISVEDTILVTSDKLGHKIAVPVPQGAKISLNVAALHHNRKYRLRHCISPYCYIIEILQHVTGTNHKTLNQKDSLEIGPETPSYPSATVLGHVLVASKSPESPSQQCGSYFTDSLRLKASRLLPCLSRNIRSKYRMNPRYQGRLLSSAKLEFYAPIEV